MRSRPVFAFSVATLAVMAVACGGLTSAPLGPDDSGTPDAATVTVDGATCVDLKTGPGDLDCTTDDDCTFAETGVLCVTSCSCGGGAPVNLAARTRLDAELVAAKLPSEICSGGCSEPPMLVCISGQCTACDRFPPYGPNPACPAGDGGTVVIDAGPPVIDAGSRDSGIGTVDAHQTKCVDVELSMYDQSCNDASDCIVIFTGELCDGACECGGEPVNKSGAAQFAQATSGIVPGACGCPVEANPQCLNGTCSF